MGVSIPRIKGSTNAAYTPIVTLTPIVIIKIEKNKLKFFFFFLLIYLAVTKQNFEEICVPY